MTDRTAGSAGDEDLRDGTLASALEREHREIDRGIGEFTAGAPATESLHPAMVALRRHVYLEEQFLFPPLRQAGLMMPILVMLREHGALWDAMAAIEVLLDGDTRDDAIGDPVAACQDLLVMLERHNSKEEPILYSQADPVLTPQATAELHAFIEAGQMPEGWVCERATR
ncbi:MAG: hemerythrin domain-containing protein [Micrococcales bacterium]|nr:hemerythrin domain-containing protein [Micrococcales bacterium]